MVSKARIIDHYFTANLLYVFFIGNTLETVSSSFLLQVLKSLFYFCQFKISGSLYASGGANPLLYEPVWQAARAVASPNEEGSTLYDDWLKQSSKTYANGVVKPKIGSLGSGSDFASFLQLYGISCADIYYVRCCN